MRIRHELGERLRRLGPMRSAPAFDDHEYAAGGLVPTSDGVGAPSVTDAGDPLGSELHLLVLAGLRPAILIGDLPPGIRLIEEEVAEYFGVSRGPVREALGVLRDEGLVTVSPRRGAVVIGVTAEDIDNLYDLRIVLECHAIRRAAVRVGTADLVYLRRLDVRMIGVNATEHTPSDIAFHRFLMVLARQERLLSAWERLAGTIGGLLAVTNTSRPELVRHANLIAALEVHDPETAAAILHLHIRNAHRIMRGVLAARMSTEPADN